MSQKEQQTEPVAVTGSHFVCIAGVRVPTDPLRCLQIYQREIGIDAGGADLLRA
jgi:hypothetical protein